ncbi:MULTISPECIES: OsmC family protein [unclassified Virgibacillus]|uniref:OsmC family protein n=1 Tax=unclassified Virgibacillus TaxID=2620237 RepID=UPI0024DEB4FF|nr:OsmC family protein [Virgibacillus sp. LDC-1]
MNGINFEAMEQTVKAIKADPSLKIKSWKAHVKRESGIVNSLKIRDFDPILMDEPTPLGGTDKGANPIEMLIGTAGSCFAITFEVLASQAGIALEHVSVEVDADLNAAVFLGLEEGDGGILNPMLTLTVESDASKQQITEIAKVALEKSPVLASLKAELKLVIA